jgi:hypothetical protein
MESLPNYYLNIDCAWKALKCYCLCLDEATISGLVQVAKSGGCVTDAIERAREDHQLKRELDSELAKVGYFYYQDVTTVLCSPN